MVSALLCGVAQNCFNLDRPRVSSMLYQDVLQIASIIILESERICLKEILRFRMIEINTQCHVAQRTLNKAAQNNILRFSYLKEVK